MSDLPKVVRIVTLRCVRCLLQNESMQSVYAGVTDKDSTKSQKHKSQTSSPASVEPVHAQHSQQEPVIVSTPTNTGLPAPSHAAERATPTDAAGLPTPFGTTGRAVLPPTPFTAQTTAGPPAATNAQAFAWRNRAYNAAFKGRSPSSSRYMQLATMVM